MENSAPTPDSVCRALSRESEGAGSKLDPDKFDPDRFLTDEQAGAPTDPFNYVFGFGRRCVYAFAE